MAHAVRLGRLALCLVLGSVACNQPDASSPQSEDWLADPDEIPSALQQVPSGTTASSTCQSMAPASENVTTTLATEYTKWKNSYLKTVASGAIKVKRFKDPRDPNQGYDTVSEGIAYGMLFSAYLRDRGTFDGLWSYAKAHFNNHGLMSWHLNESDGVVDVNAATDADQDMAIALLVASGVWEAAAEARPYRSAAICMIKNIKKYEVEVRSGQVAPKYVLKPGDVWGGSEVTNPSYFAPAYYRVFAEVMGDNTWIGIASDAFTILSRTMDQNTGLHPDWATMAGKPAINKDLQQVWSYDYGYDATRVPLRLAMDACWNPSAASPRTRLGRLNNYFANKIKDPGLIKGPYKLDGAGPYKPDGTPLEQYHNAAFVGPAGAAAIILSPTMWAPLREKMWNETKMLQELNNYYNESLRLFSLLVMSNRMTKPEIASGVMDPPC